MVPVMRSFEPESMPLHVPETALQRTRGAGRVALRSDGVRTVLDRLYQEGAAKIRLPRGHDTPRPEVCLINTAGGHTGGDRFDWAVTAGAETQAVVTTPACEKIYRAIGGEPARIENRVHVKAGARLDWLPQETILFDGGALSRTLDVELAGDAVFLALEAVVFGRRAMGETVVAGRFHDRWRVRREGRLVFADDFAIHGPIAERLDRPAVADGGRAMATLLLVAADAERYVDRVRDGLGTHAGASAADGKLLARIVADDMYSLRHQVGVALEIVMDARGLPKMWAT